MRRLTLHAAALSPLISIPIFTVWFAVFYLFFREPGDMVDSWVWLLIFLGYALPIAYIVSFLVGIPVDWFLRRLGVVSPATYGIVGIVLGGAIGVKMYPLSHLSACIALCGFAISVLFGVISNAKDEMDF